MTVKWLLVVCASIGLLRCFLEMRSTIPSVVARGAGVLLFAGVLVAGLTSTDGLSELAAVLCYLALCVLGIAQLIDWVKQALSSGPKASHHVPDARSPDRKAAPAPPSSAGPTEAPSKPRPSLPDWREHYAVQLEDARAAEARGDPDAAHRVGLFLQLIGDDLRGAEKAYHRAEATGDPQGASALAELYALRGDHDAARAAELHGDKLRRARGPLPPGRQAAGPTKRPRRSPAPSGEVTRGPDVGRSRLSPSPRCGVCLKEDGEGKKIYADEEDAWNAVRISKERRAAGKPAPGLERAYYEERCGNWHVTSQAAR